MASTFSCTKNLQESVLLCEKGLRWIQVWTKMTNEAVSWKGENISGCQSVQRKPCENMTEQNPYNEDLAQDRADTLG